jgi:hypothetical protein
MYKLIPNIRRGVEATHPRCEGDNPHTESRFRVRKLAGPGQAFMNILPAWLIMRFLPNDLLCTAFAWHDSWSRLVGRGQICALQNSLCFDHITYESTHQRNN